MCIWMHAFDRSCNLYMFTWLSTEGSWDVGCLCNTGDVRDPAPPGMFEIWNPPNIRMNYVLTGAGFLPSTVHASCQGGCRCWCWNWDHVSHGSDVWPCGPCACYRGMEWWRLISVMTLWQTGMKTTHTHRFIYIYIFNLERNKDEFWKNLGGWGIEVGKWRWRQATRFPPLSMALHFGGITRSCSHHSQSLGASVVRRGPQGLDPKRSNASILRRCCFHFFIFFPCCRWFCLEDRGKVSVHCGYAEKLCSLPGWPSDEVALIVSVTLDQSLK